MARRRNSSKVFLAVILLGVLIGLIIGYYVFSVPPKAITATKYVYIQPNATYNSAEIVLAAVDQNGNGVVTPLVVDAKPGNGKILTDIDKLLFWVDTQQSMQIAKQVAENFTGIDADIYDLVYTVRSNSTLVGGPSAGGSLTAATIAALRGKKIRADVLMTGTINPDGTIGEVGGILEKASAAKDVGAKVFLVPAGQSIDTSYKPQESCEMRGNFEFCTTKFVKVTTNIGQQVGISIIEVESISDAIKYIMD